MNNEILEINVPGGNIIHILIDSSVVENIKEAFALIKQKAVMVNDIIVDNPNKYFFGDDIIIKIDESFELKVFLV